MVRLTEEEQKLFEARAKYLGLSLSAWARMTLKTSLAKER